MAPSDWTQAGPQLNYVHAHWLVCQFGKGAEERSRDRAYPTRERILQISILADCPPTSRMRQKRVPGQMRVVC